MSDTPIEDKAQEKALLVQRLFGFAKDTLVAQAPSFSEVQQLADDIIKRNQFLIKVERRAAVIEALTTTKLYRTDDPALPWQWQARYFDGEDWCWVNSFGDTPQLAIEDMKEHLAQPEKEE